MDLKKLKSKKGFTLIELMVVIVIIGILVAIALPNFISAQDRAKVSSVKANMHTLQTQLETYAVDWSGRYPFNTTELTNEATNKKYVKELKNPFNSSSASIATTHNRAVVGAATTGGNFTASSPAYSAVITGVTAGGTATQGTSVYSPYDPSITGNAANTTDSLTAYNLYGISKENNGPLIGEKGSVFTLSNG